ncbi:BTB/POZ domain-containing protein [Aspergillus affinis]|uniref:BTB/POZ domain-containing protein n=1 Tax=Aspergillus affinis TaxID=1070780 RepID=UPI0022FF0408|nr:uncharacterized protein KD926_007805 [Aspergillus affinis]KAI9040724.1 hypothetical protein KD926_007805 [Aspergillus affinis]
MSQEDTQPDNLLQEFDPNGDVIFVVGEGMLEKERKFLVSSRVLSLASPVFAKLFSESFSEGIELKKGTCPELSLPEDDPQAMETIFRIAHFLKPEEVAPPMTEFPAKVAVHANKYDCMKVVAAWLTKHLYHPRLRRRQDDLDAINFGHMLLSAFLLQDPETFHALSALAQKSMTPGNLEAWEYSGMLQPGLFPQEISGRFP